MSNRVTKRDGCPWCGERDADRLEHREDGKVKCLHCGTVYTPGGKR